MDTTDPPLNLATRCMSCSTVFRVAEDQLLASDGWVRCGRCSGVFNAAEVLFDVDTGTPMRLALPPPAAEPALAPDRAPATARNDPDGPLLRAPSRSSSDADEPIFITDHVPPPVAAEMLPATAGPATDDGPALGAAPAAAGSTPLAMPQQAAPSFMRQAEQYVTGDK